LQCTFCINKQVIIAVKAIGWKDDIVMPMILISVCWVCRCLAGVNPVCSSTSWSHSSKT
jgi:hypothetical protein